MRDEVTAILDRFTADAASTVPLTALWAHGSLALGDYQHRRSDIDLVAVVGAAVTERQRRQLGRLHKALIAGLPDAAKLHCSYLADTELADPAIRHVTWAQGTLMTRPVTAVTRRELHQGGLTLVGPPPAALLPAVTDQELADFVRADLRTFWYPATAKRTRWLRDIWVDHGLLVLARATVTLEEGRLITKGEALDVLAAAGAPADVLAGIRLRRYGDPRPPTLPQRFRRGRAARSYLRAGIENVLASP